MFFFWSKEQITKRLALITKKNSISTAHYCVTVHFSFGYTILLFFSFSFSFQLIQIEETHNVIVLEIITILRNDNFEKCRKKVQERSTSNNIEKVNINS